MFFPSPDLANELQESKRFSWNDPHPIQPNPQTNDLKPVSASASNVPLKQSKDCPTPKPKDNQTLSHRQCCIVSGLLSSVKTEKAKLVLQHHKLRIQEVVVEGVARMFDFVEDGDRASDKEICAAARFRLASINNRGMPQQKSTRKRNNTKLVS